MEMELGKLVRVPKSESWQLIKGIWTSDWSLFSLLANFQTKSATPGWHQVNLVERGTSFGQFRVQWLKASKTLVWVIFYRELRRVELKVEAASTPITNRFNSHTQCMMQWQCNDDCTADDDYDEFEYDYNQKCWWRWRWIKTDIKGCIWHAGNRHPVLKWIKITPLIILELLFLFKLE